MDTTLRLRSHTSESLAAHVYSIEGNVAKIAYPIELFEPSNMPNILSSVAGNVFGLKALKNLRLLDIEFPKQILSSFKGPAFGISRNPQTPKSSKTSPCRHNNQTKTRIKHQRPCKSCLRRMERRLRHRKRR